MSATSQCKEKFEDYEGFVEKFNGFGFIHASSKNIKNREIIQARSGDIPDGATLYHINE